MYVLLITPEFPSIWMVSLYWSLSLCTYLYKICIVNHSRVPKHLDGVPILVIESNPEFEADEKRAQEMMKEVSL